MSEGRWVFVTPAPGRDFDLQLFVAIVRRSAPSHIWVANPRGFVMKFEDYRRWIADSGSIEFVSPHQTKMFRLGCGPQLDDVMQQLQAEMPQITKELAESIRR